ncbi:MAG: alpha/beta fold hydrolase [Bacteroidota bacterium]
MSIAEILPILLALIFITTGTTKIVGLGFQKKEFKHWNLPLWVRYATGLIEIIAGTLLCFDSMMYFGAILGSFILLGATVMLWVADENRRSLLPLTLLVICGYLMWQTVPGTLLTWSILGTLGFSLLMAMALWFYAPTPMNQDGETEIIDENCTVTHRFEETLGVRYHYVTAGNKQNPTVVMIHGFPESWYCFHHQIAALSEKYHVIALDLKPYGQTAKDLDGDHSFEHIAEEIKTLLDKIGVEKFHLIGHDRGTIASDNLLAKSGMQERIISFVRMQQSFNEPHGKPEPPHHLMGSFWGILAFRLRFSMWAVYKKSPYTKLHIPKKTIDRIEKEFKYKNTALAVPLSFKTTSFAKELKDRQDFIFEHMTMPTLILQGRFDPGQHPEEYANSHTIIPNCEVKFVEAGHFFHVEAPGETSEFFLAFLRKHDLEKTS